MSYIVPTDIPQFCNKCPFGNLFYSHPAWVSKAEINRIDGGVDKPSTHGYICNIDVAKNGKYTKVMRSHIDDDIPKPDWCKLKEVIE